MGSFVDAAASTDATHRPVLVIEQDPRLPGTGRVGQRLSTRGDPAMTVRAYSTDFAGLDPAAFRAVISLGGSQHVWSADCDEFLVQERHFLARAVQTQTPVLGICLGAQLLAQALGGSVRAAAAAEIGWLPVTPLPEAAGDPVFGWLDADSRFFQWHADVFEAPPGARVLATSDACRQQVFRHGCAWGVQFHLEVDSELFERWLGLNPNACVEAGVDESALRGAVSRGAAASAAQVHSMLDAFLDHTSQNGQP